MNVYVLYLIAVVLGNVAYFLSGGYRRIFWNDYKYKMDWPDPASAPMILLFLMTPLPGIVALFDFVLYCISKVYK